MRLIAHNAMVSHQAHRLIFSNPIAAMTNPILMAVEKSSSAEVPCLKARNTLPAVPNPKRTINRIARARIFQSGFMELAVSELFGCRTVLLILLRVHPAIASFRNHCSFAMKKLETAGERRGA
jgi:hypothetical protein